MSSCDLQIKFIVNFDIVSDMDMLLAMRIFIRVGEGGSISAAARDLGSCGRSCHGAAEARPARL